MSKTLPEVEEDETVDEDVLFTSPSRSVRRKNPRPAYEPVCLKNSSIASFVKNHCFSFFPISST